MVESLNRLFLCRVLGHLPVGPIDHGLYSLVDDQFILTQPPTYICGKCHQTIRFQEHRYRSFLIGEVVHHRWDVVA